ncbi:hypothetical protein F11_00340 [Rhodospirillum rubrum F11]|uniref:GIY-YIG domain-containing protein n=1 Tax=Rhodospirillum rubrum (strain ATCC 11170 / ATH 1.1.1 / DSM 467 / LMG 4362 / NCIMB 8255 / S1) TaxID=269796 RepID=Q2RYC3_RHORT|nr:GIY-YIG nuclease family protein [Rhodospirillum rubrum]ABC20872.1 Protein of unknown function DUF123 [Rhodospirillum rubrum ATCC 11170]AEO46539.1 hypothetical protein F11_00340 [Rhodospirillum rubrum F11]MBK5952429.1 endonuclease III [Rhodospirillum rubrum]QXG80573.1 GIY-YIG nuclease family protein [Rhodospirillum rubrum]
MRAARWTAEAADLPAVAGAYLLLIDLARPVALAPPLDALLPPGRYVYCGSARGPGGIRARCARHLRAGKTLRWHVDRLSEAARALRVLAVVDGDECALVARLRALEGAGIPVAGFGASDCRTCPAHLLSLPGSAAQVAKRIREAL